MTETTGNLQETLREGASVVEAVAVGQSTVGGWRLAVGSYIIYLLTLNVEVARSAGVSLHFDNYYFM